MACPHGYENADYCQPCCDARDAQWARDNPSEGRVMEVYTHVATAPIEVQIEGTLGHKHAMPIGEIPPTLYLNQGDRLILIVIPAEKKPDA